MLSGAAFAAPPPPRVYPADLPEQAGGYDLPPIYAVYGRWVDRGREPALRRALAFERQWNGMHYAGTVVESQIVHYDYDAIRMDRLDRYCTGDWLKNEPAGACEHRYRYAIVPGPLFDNEEVEERLVASFEPRHLVALFAKENWEQPDRNEIWRDEQLRQIFERHTDLAALYHPLVELHDVSSSACPGLDTAIAGLGRVTLELAPEDLPPDYMRPHGWETRIKATAATPKGGRVVLEGSRSLYDLMEPIWTVVDGCSEKGAPRGAPSVVG